MADDGLLAVGGVGVLAVVAIVVAVLRDGDRVINIPSDFGESGDPSDGVPDDLPEPDPDMGEPSDARSEVDTTPSGDVGLIDSPIYDPDESSIPDSLEAFDPAGRVDLVTGDGEGDDSETWVGL